MPLHAGRFTWLLWPAVLVAVQRIFFPAPLGSLVAGLVLGAITSLVALGMYLVYRANRVLNFAAGELGLLPAVFVVLLIIESGLSWYLSFGIGLLSAALVGVGNRGEERPVLVVEPERGVDRTRLAERDTQIRNLEKSNTELKQVTLIS